MSLINYTVFFKVVLGQRQNILQSAEFRLRNDLFNFSFKMVRPVLHPSDVVNVFLNVELKALTEVVSQHLMLLEGSWCIMMNPCNEWIHRPSVFLTGHGAN